VRRRSGGTFASAWATCSPQPVQVILPQWRQQAGLRIGRSFAGGIKTT